MKTLAGHPIGYPDDLTRYVFNNYSGLLSKAESTAWGSLIARDKAAMAQGSPIADDHLKDAAEWEAAASTDPVVAALLQRGPEAFYVSVTLRILRDHPDEIDLILCPRCLGLCNTPRAKQCPKCFHSWHEEAS